MYINRLIIFGRLTEDPIYKVRHGGSNSSEEYCILRCHTEKPIKINYAHNDVRQKEDIYFEVLAFGNNASSIKNRVYRGTPLLFELEVRNIDQGDGKRTMVLQAVKIHFMDRSPRRLDNYNKDETKEEVSDNISDVAKLQGMSEAKAAELREISEQIEEGIKEDPEEVPETEEVKAE